MALWGRSSTARIDFLAAGPSLRSIDPASRPSAQRRAGERAIWPGPQSPALVPAESVMKVLRLVREGAEIDDPVEQQAHLLDGLCALVGGEVAVCFEFEGVGGVPTRGFLHGLSDDEQRRVVSAYTGQGDGFDLMAGHMRREFAAGETPVLTCLRGELVSDREWYRSAYVADFRRVWGIDHCIYSISALGGRFAGMSVNRGFGAAPFDAEARELVRIFQLECGWLAQARKPAPASADPAEPALPPRARDVLAALLRGAADKEIAEELGLSPHTVRQYVKHIYRSFGVKSRSELLARRLTPR